jgi:hypothetical protein
MLWEIESNLSGLAIAEISIDDGTGIRLNYREFEAICWLDLQETISPGGEKAKEKTEIKFRISATNLEYKEA